MIAADDIVVRHLAPDEASLLVALIRRCYGETYIDPSYYREEVVAELLRSGRLHSIGALTSTGQLVGHMGINLRPHGGITADAGMTLVDPAFRGMGIARRLAIGLAQQSMALGLVGVHDYPVTVHAATQRIGAGFGVDTGLMLSNVPADVAFREMETSASSGRTNSLIRWLPFGVAPERHVWPPERYRERIEALYVESRLSRAVLEPAGQPSERPSELELSYDERRQILRVAVVRVARDLAAKVDAETRNAVKRGALVAHVDLPLTDPETPVAAQGLRTLGFSFAGLLPEYRDGDVLRLQWLTMACPASYRLLPLGRSRRSLCRIAPRACLTPKAFSLEVSAMKPRQILVHIPIIAAAFTFCVGCASEPCPPCEAAPASGMEGKSSGGEADAKQYYALPGLDHGLVQSPVNILTDQAKGGKHMIEFPEQGEGAEEVENLGHTVQLSFGSGITTQFEGKAYEFQQLHFHTPSEHLIDGITFPMEIHLVHSRPGPSPQDPPDYLVIALHFRMGETNRFIDEFLDAIPTEEGETAELDHVFLADVFPPGFDVKSIDYYHYSGSLTTPPYTESVEWLIAKKLLEASREQILRINALEGNNARHVQAKYGREID